MAVYSPDEAPHPLPAPYEHEFLGTAIRWSGSAPQGIYGKKRKKTLYLRDLDSRYHD